jgi:hypothetical protein
LRYKLLIILGLISVSASFAVSSDTEQKRHTPQDLAVIVNFPEHPIRIPDYRSFWNWWAHVFDTDKDNNVRVGHTGVILVNGSTGELQYFDFGRYDDRNDLMGPRPAFYGVVRSAAHVPLLEMKIRAHLENGWIANLDTILLHLGSKKLLRDYGKMEIAIVYQLDYEKMIVKARSYEDRGYIYYGAPAHLYCTSFVRKVIDAGGSAFGYLNFTGSQTVRHVRKKFKQLDL